MPLSAEQVAPHEARFLAMLDTAFRGYGVPDGLPEQLRAAVAATPRHLFVHRFRIGDGPLRDNDADPGQNLTDIYSDAVMRHVDRAGEPLPSSNSQPSYVLFLLHLVGLRDRQAVLEIGSGSGWLAAIMARLVGPQGRVTGVELIDELAARSRADLESLGLRNVEIIAGDGTGGYAAGAPFDAAIVTAATWDVPFALLDQVAEAGRLLIPVELRSGDGCDVTVLRKQASALLAERSVPGWFVPLRGEGQDRTGVMRIPPPDGEPVGRHALPLGVLSDGRRAPAAALFRAFLGRTEPGFVVVAGEPDDGWRPGIAISPFGMKIRNFGIMAPDRSTALWRAGEIISHGGLSAARRLARAYARWTELGLPGIADFRLEVYRAGTAPAATDELWLEPRGATVLMWRLKPRAAPWRDLLAADEVAN
jgi:protein-L-isoaspartate(D-aspartate) O-methyltransferase